MPHRRSVSMATVRKQSAAAASRMAVFQALAAGATLRYSNRTDIEAGLVHAGTARRLVLTGVAVRVPDPAKPGWTLDQIVSAQKT